MARIQHGHILAVLFVLFHSNTHAQSNPGMPPSSDSDSQPQIAATPAAPLANTRGTGGYIFPDGKQQFHNYLFNAFGPPALISTAIGAALDQNKPAPPEWDSGAQGYGERYGFRYGMNLIDASTKYSLGAVMHEDVAYHRCNCRGFFFRGTHAIVSTLTAETRSGKTIFSMPALVSPYAGSFAAVNAWYPSRYEPADAFRIGSTSFMFKVVGNFVAEFIAPPR
jgi:hypothetical protein